MKIINFFNFNRLNNLNNNFIRFERKKKPEKIHVLGLLDEGKSEEEIADITGFTKEEIHKALLSWGVKFKRSIADKHKEEIKELIESGKSLNEIADMFGCSVSTIRNIQSKYGLRAKTVIEQNKREIISMRLQGKSQQEIADTIHSHQTSIGNALRRWGLSGGKNVFEENKEFIIGLYKNGSTMQEIADKLDCTAQAVKYNLTKWGVEIREVKNINNHLDEIKAMVEQGKDADYIAKALGFSKQIVCKALKSMDIQTSNYAKRGTTELYKDIIIQMRDENKSYKEIAEFIGCSQSAVEHAILRWSNQQRRKNPNSIAEQNKEFILHSYLYENKKAQEIAEILHCDRSVVSRALSEWGIKGKPPLTELYKDKIIELHLKRVPAGKIAKIIGCSHSTIVYALKKWGY